MAKVLIGCRLPNGLILQKYSTDRKVGSVGVQASVKLRGLNESKIVGATYVTTEVDAEFWELFKRTNPNYAPMKSGAIFEASSTAQAEAKGKELSKKPTGLEPIKPDTMGVKTADKD